MDTPKQSDLLHTRLQQRKAESARASKLRSQRPIGRDDGAFDVALDSPKANMSTKLQQSPSPDPLRRQGQKPGSRRGSNMAASKDTTARAMGLRELEEHIDKLSKQNFDLKLEVYHRREKIEELEKKLKAATGLAEDFAELTQVNEDLVKELEGRDNAVDEAVVMICDLEEKVRRLEEDLVDTRPSTAQPTVYTTTDTEESAIQSYAQRSKQKTKDGEASRQPKDNSRKQVSPEVSARMASLAKPPRTPRTPRAVQPPSFLLDDQPSTHVLRSLFVDGDKSIRPIPSHASLLSRQTVRDNDDAYPDVLNSPRLSALSESDLKSLYGQDQSESSLKNSKRETPKLETQNHQATKEQKRARIDRWVELNLPVQQPKLKRAPKGLTPDVAQYQSLGDVLHQDRSQAREKPSARTVENLSAPSTVQPIKTKRTPPMALHQTFGQNLFPPTPDTMITNNANHSATSIVHERSQNDHVPAPGTFAAQIPLLQRPLLATPQAVSGSTRRPSRLPHEVDAYDDGDSFSGPHPYQHAAGYASDHTNQSSPLQYRYDSPTHNSPSAGLQLKSWRRSFEHPSSSHSSHRPSGLSRTNTEPNLNIELVSPTSSTSPVATRGLFDTSPTLASLALTRSHFSEIPVRPLNVLPAHPRQHQYSNSSSTLQTATHANQANSPPTSYPFQRSISLRDRVRHFTRRGSVSSTNLATPTPTDTETTPATATADLSSDSGLRPRRRTSLKNRIFRRSSSAHEPSQEGRRPYLPRPFSRRASTTTATSSSSRNAINDFDSESDNNAAPPPPFFGPPPRRDLQPLHYHHHLHHHRHQQQLRDHPALRPTTSTSGSSASHSPHTRARSSVSGEALDLAAMTQPLAAGSPLHKGWNGPPAVLPLQPQPHAAYYADSASAEFRADGATGEGGKRFSVSVGRAGGGGARRDRRESFVMSDG